MIQQAWSSRREMEQRDPSVQSLGAANPGESGVETTNQWL